MQEGSSLLINTRVVRPQECKQVALGLISNHFDDVAQVLTFRGELDHSAFAAVANFDALGKLLALSEELRHAIADRAQLLAELAMGDLEATHSGAVLFGIGFG